MKTQQNQNDLVKQDANIPIVSVLDCGHAPSEHSDFTTGYGTGTDGKTYCYSCCADRDRAQMRQDGRIALYLTNDKDAQATVSNWPGSLKLGVYHQRIGRHNMAGKRYDVWFTFETQPWHGVTYGDNTQICHCRRIKSK